MNCVLIKKEDIQSDNCVEISKEKSEHLINIVKVNIGDGLKVTVADCGVTNATVTKIENAIVTLRTEEIRNSISYPITLIIAASRPPTMKKVIEHATSLGVTNFIIIGANLTEKSYLQSKLYQNKEFQDLTGLGLSQSVCFYKMPTINLYKNIMSADIPKSNQNFILSPYARDKLINLDITLKENTTLAIGPERGWSKDEIEYFKGIGFKDVAISPSILRVEIATFCALGILNSKMI